MAIGSEIPAVAGTATNIAEAAQANETADRKARVRTAGRRMGLAAALMFSRMASAFRVVNAAILDRGVPGPVLACSNAWRTGIEVGAKADWVFAMFVRGKGAEVMLDQFNVGVTLPAADLERAKAWYEEKLGLTPEKEWPMGARYRSGSSFFDIYPTPNAGTAKNTAAGWNVENLEAVVDELRSRGVVFEEYDFPGLRTDNGIAAMDGERAAWFVDSEGNILSISELT